MNYFDPARPKIGDRPALVIGDHVICTIPHLNITPITRGYVEVEVMVMIAPNTARWLHWHGQSEKFITGSSIDDLVRRYEADPELVLATEFNWVYNQQAVRRPRMALSLDDLGNLE